MVGAVYLTLARRPEPRWSFEREGERGWNGGGLIRRTPLCVYNPILSIPYYSTCPSRLRGRRKK